MEGDEGSGLMNTLVVGAGALGGVITGRLLDAGVEVALATRDRTSADRVLTSGVRITGVGGDVMVDVNRVAPLSDYRGQSFDLVLLATKAQAAIELAPKLIPLLAPGGTLLPIQNGGVSRLLADQVGEEYVLGGLSNLGATMIAHGVYEQRNAGHILIGELRGGSSKRTTAVKQWLAQGIDVRTTCNLRGSMWSKLLLNCSVTTIGAILGCTMREYVQLPLGREVFEKTYAEALNVVLALGEHPETMLVEPIPPSRTGSGETSQAYDGWFQRILDNYGGTKPSMLQDFQRRRSTEIDFINGYVVGLGKQNGINVVFNEVIVAIVKAIADGDSRPSEDHLSAIIARAS
jgi:2-dehydropantoate 2-reductase